MTQYLATLTLEALSALTLEELATLGINEPITTNGHTPFIVSDIISGNLHYSVRNAEAYNSLFTIEYIDMWST